MNVLSLPAVVSLGWTLLHFLWQGAGVALLLKGLTIAMRRCSAQARYLVLCFGFALLAVCPIITYLQLSPVGPGVRIPFHRSGDIVSLEGEARRPDAREPVVAIPPANPGPRPLPSLTQRLERVLPWIVAAWAAGVLALAVRFMGGWIHVRSVTRHGAILPETAGQCWHQWMANLARSWGIARPVNLLISKGVNVPTTIGWLRPVVLLPASTLTGLSPRQLEAILAHELAHIRRLDYLVNIIQSLVETVLFYHPAVWWISAEIRRERENCCDDLALSVCQDRLIYARALTTLEEKRSALLDLKLAASGGLLLRRIQRILATPSEKRVLDGWVAGSVLLVLGLATLAGNSLLRGEPAKDAAGVPDAVTTQLYTRRYKVDTATFVRGLTRSLQTNDGTITYSDSNSPSLTESGDIRVTDLPKLMRTYFAQFGVIFASNAVLTTDGPLGATIGTPAAGKAVCFNDRTGLLLVRATLPEQDNLERSILMMDASNPIPSPQNANRQIKLVARWIEIKGSGTGQFDWLFGRAGAAIEVEPKAKPSGDGLPGGGSPYATNISVFANTTADEVVRLSKAQSKALVDYAKNQPGVDILSSAGVTTLSGREAEVSVVELKSVVAGVGMTPDEKGKTAGTVYFTPIPVPVGPSLRVMPHWREGQWELVLRSQLTEFLGYRDAGAATFGALTAKKPAPEFRVRESTATVWVQSGESLFLRMPATEETVRVKKTSWFGRATESRITKRLYLLIECREPDPEP